MNIWEAYQHVKAGSVIKCLFDNQYTFFIFQTVEEPLDIKRIKQFDVHDQDVADCPMKISDIPVKDLEEVCLVMFENETYELSNLDAMLKASKEKWHEDNEEDDSKC